MISAQKQIRLPQFQVEFHRHLSQELILSKFRSLYHASELVKRTKKFHRCLDQIIRSHSILKISWGEQELILVILRVFTRLKFLANNNQAWHLTSLINLDKGKSLRKEIEAKKSQANGLLLKGFLLSQTIILKK